jgi:glycosyltransferase involved in cell wall biosynthesis
VSIRADRILLVLPSLERGGGERVLLQLARSFLAAGREVHLAVLVGGGPLRSEVPAQATLHELDSGDARGFALVWRALPKLVSLMRSTQPDAVLSTMTGTNLLTTVACMRARSRARLVLREAASLVNTKSALKRQAMRWLYRRADALIAVSTGVAEDLIGLGLARNRVHVIHNPVDTGRLQLLATSELPTELRSCTPYVVSVGRLSAQKDQQTLLRAYAQSSLRESHHLVIVGGGALRAQLEHLAHDLGISGRVILTGSLGNPYPVLARASLHALSSRWEGYPNVLLEALALGIPVVSTDCPFGPRELLDDGRYGRLVPVADPTALAQAMVAELVKPSTDIDRAVAAHNPQAIGSRYLLVLDGSLEVLEP